MSLDERLKAHFTTIALVLIPITVGINVVGGWTASTLKLPIWIDVIGTIIAGVMAGPWVAGTVGLLTNVFLGLVMNPVYFPYAIVNIAIGLVVGYLAMRGWFKSWGMVVLVGLCVVATQVLTASPITVYLFGGVTGATGVSFLTAYFIATSQKIFASVLKAQIIFALIDKMLSVFVAYLVIRAIPTRFLSQVTRASVAREE